MNIFDVELEDSVLRAEIGLVVELMVAASGSAGALDQRVIDTILAAADAAPVELATAC